MVERLRGCALGPCLRIGGVCLQRWRFDGPELLSRVFQVRLGALGVGAEFKCRFRMSVLRAMRPALSYDSPTWLRPLNLAFFDREGLSR